MRPGLLPLMAACAALAIGCPAGSPSREALRSGRSDPGPEAVSLLGEPLMARPRGPDSDRLEADLAAARADLAASPDDPEKIIWVGRRLGYLWRMREAIAVYTAGIQNHPGHAALYRHRGHRYVSARRFEEAIADLERAAQLLRGEPDEVEQDGMPNARNIPLTTTAFNVWYHLGLARYLTGDYERAVAAYREAMAHTRGHADNLVAASDWMYMALCRLSRRQEAAGLLEPIDSGMEIIENSAYHRRLLLYKGELRPDQILDPGETSPLQIATLGYGLGNWYLDRGDSARALELFRRVVATGEWPAFGVIAAEAELARRR